MSSGVDFGTDRKLTINAFDRRENQPLRTSPRRDMEVPALLPHRVRGLQIQKFEMFPLFGLIENLSIYQFLF